MFFPSSSGRDLIDPSLQDKVLIPSGSSKIFTILDVDSIFILQSILDSYLEVKIQAVFFLNVDLGDKSHKDPDEIDLNVPRHSQYLHNAWKRHQDAVLLG